MSSAVVAAAVSAAAPAVSSATVAGVSSHATTAAVAIPPETTSAPVSTTAVGAATAALVGDENPPTSSPPVRPFPFLDLRVPTSTYSPPPSSDPNASYFMSEEDTHVTITYFHSTITPPPIQTDSTTSPTITIIPNTTTPSNPPLSFSPPQSMPEVRDFDLNKMGDTELPGYETDIARYFENENPDEVVVETVAEKDKGKRPMHAKPTRRVTRSATAARGGHCGGNVATSATGIQPDSESSSHDDSSDEDPAVFQTRRGQKRPRTATDMPFDPEDESELAEPSRPSRRRRPCVARPRSFEERYNIVISKSPLIERGFDTALT